MVSIQERNKGSKGIPKCQMVAALDGATKEMAFESRPEEIEGMNRKDIWPKSISS